MSFTTHCYAKSFERCLYNFYNNTPPLTINNALTLHNYDLCYTAFAVKYSGLSKTGLWSASYITPESLNEALKIKRSDSFHEESRIPKIHRSLLKDYKGSRFDRGHLSPSADRISIKDQYDSFSLTNMIPQSPYVNQEAWRLAEEALRAFVIRTKQPVYVVTGSLFLGNKLRLIGDNVLVPSHIYKVILFPKLNIAGAYVAVNDESGRIDYVSVNQLQNYSGIVFFPTAMKSELFNYRFLLPLNTYEANHMSAIKVAAIKDSNILNQLPLFGSANKPPLKGLERTPVKQNRLDAANLAADAALSNVSLLSDWFKRFLSK